jgi:hypothetical protein
MGPFQELKMTVRPSILFLCTILITALPSLGQDQSTPQSHLAAPLTALSNNDDLKKELLRIQMEVSQIAQDMDAIDAQMMRGIANKASSETSKVVPKVHEQLQGHSPDRTIRVFFDSPRSDIKWELCLMTSKLYTNLFDKVFEMNKEHRAGDEETRRSSSIADEWPEAVQLVFLARMMAELEFRYAEIQSQLMTDPDNSRQELWRRLREALQNDDRAYLEKLKSLLTRTGVSPRLFAAKVVSDAQKTSHTAAATVVEAMGIVNPEEDIWGLADITGVNPDFVQALGCDRRAMKDFLATGSKAAFIQTCSCRKYANGSYILALAENRADPAKSTDVVGKTQSNVGGLPQNPFSFRLPGVDPTRDLPNPKTGAIQPGGESKGPTFSVNIPSGPKPKIPSWWIRCECPDDHPDAGMVVDGVRWHAPVLHCPNPEIKLRQMK